MTNKAAIEIIPFKEHYSEAFYEINQQWISSMFVMEEIDEKTLRNPQKYIIEPGGTIFMAMHESLGAVGTISLKKSSTNPKDFELTKMGVLPKARGLGIGQLLLDHMINYITRNNISCYLLTNSNCKAAIHLYENNSFHHCEEVMQLYGSDYERCDVAMRFRI